MAGRQPFIDDNGARENITLDANAIEIDSEESVQGAIESLQELVSSSKQNRTLLNVFKSTIESRLRQSSTTYKVGDSYYAIELPSGFYLECTTAGTTSSGVMTLPSNIADGTVMTDGTVKWTIRKKSSGGGTKVSFTRSLSSGTKIGTLTIDGTSTDLYSTGNTTYSNVTSSSSGLMSAADKKKLNSITIDTNGHIITSAGVLGFRIDDNDSNPMTRVEYLYDAANMVPAFMDYSNGQYTGVFDYGSWKDVWFVKNNKPLMLKSDGSVDYYLNPNNYALKEGSGASDVANLNYDGNAMVQFPLIWVKRYQKGRYKYVLFSETKYDSDFKAYAHTNADGSVKEYFYWGMFQASGNATKIRSISGQSKVGSLSTQKQVDAAMANGTKWYIGSWSQRSLITDMLVMLGKSTDTQNIFGTGHSNGSSSYNKTGYTNANTGSYSEKGQFFGVNNGGYPMKAFHLEDLIGDQWERTAGLICNKGAIYVKMTPENGGYRLADVVGYTDTGIKLASTNTYITGMNCSEFGMIPVLFKNGSNTTYYCCLLNGVNTGAVTYALAGGSSGLSAAQGGAFVLNLNNSNTYTSGSVGCRLAYV